jgi:hypothetical protein
MHRSRVEFVVNLTNTVMACSSLENAHSKYVQICYFQTECSAGGFHHLVFTDNTNAISSSRARMYLLWTKLSQALRTSCASFFIVWSACSCTVSINEPPLRLSGDRATLAIHPNVGCAMHTLIGGVQRTRSIMAFTKLIVYKNIALFTVEGIPRKQYSDRL